MDSGYVLEMKHISKSYSGNKVLKDVSICVKPGEILALIGENGAGKSTIMNILFGMPVIQATGGFEGEILVEGKKAEIHNPTEAMKLGIGMVHQEFMLIDGFEVAENIKLNREITKKNPVSAVLGHSMETIDLDAIRKDSRATLDSLGIKLSELARVGSLPVGYKQFVEISRELNKENIKLIVLDEPTAVLTESESEQFMSCVKNVAAKGIAIIFISHKLNEIKQNADKVAILRDGTQVGVYDINNLTPVMMSKLMIGREVEIAYRDHEDDLEKMETILKLENFTVNMPSEFCKNINLEIKKGEIIGIGGLAGHGKISIANGVMGQYPSLGTVTYKGEKLDTENTGKTMEKGIAFVSEDRRGAGLLLDESIEINITVAAMRIRNRFMKKFCGISLYDKKTALQYADKMIKEMDIRCTGNSQRVRMLSGGNQQKVCVARALTLAPDVLFVSEPTRGIDIGAKKMILDTLVKLNQETGMTIIITSSELAEMRAVCGRIAIVTEGSIIGILKPDAPDYMYGMYMSGLTAPEGEGVAV